MFVILGLRLLCYCIDLFNHIIAGEMLYILLVAHQAPQILDCQKKGQWMLAPDTLHIEFCQF